MGEILMNHLMFADDICVFCPSVCGLESVLNVCQAYAESHEIIFNCHKTIRMTFKAKTAKSAVIPIAVARYTKSKICCPLQNFMGLYEILSFQMTKTFRDNCNTKNLFFRMLERTEKMYFFISAVRPRMYHNYAVISGRHTSTNCV